mmetsp:Transcript_65383/g.120535  ORF Transcript_65383/g.120535 Transcript_65383/m.120535 type:complete len:905 (-) Transcript_65383:261-2975(-)
MKFALILMQVFWLPASCRDVVSFDFGWKHRTGLHEWAKPDDPPPAHPDPGPHPAEAQVDYDQADWAAIQLPHDGLIGAAPSEKACPDGCSGRSYIPRHVLWYRKAFMLPASWAGSTIWLDFEGSFRLTTVWINGVLAASHDCGYTPFRVRLDNITTVKLGQKNTIAIFVDPDNGDEGWRDRGSGWWYEGGGLYRHVSLVRSSMVHVEQDGLFAYSNLTWAKDGSPSAVMHASAAITNAGNQSASVCVAFVVTAADGSEVAADRDGKLLSIAAGASVTVVATLKVQSPKLWTASAPFLYRVTASIHEGACSASSIDAVQATHGFRSLRYDANEGFFLNNNHFKVRGFCDHSTFAVVGMAVPERINLFRAQASRAVGGNGRRTSHNPPDTSMLAIYDRLGVVVMDENRLFANTTKYVNNMGVLVKRDRNHPSVVIWSFCNEAGCEGSHETGGPRFREISYKYDGSRPTLANMFTFGDLLSNTIDVQGFSHQSRSKMDDCHAKLPHKPIYMSECCSCNTMRDEDEGCETVYDNPHNACIQKSFNARCTESNSATNASDGVNYAVGTMVWTLFDYYGEPPEKGLEVSGTYGQYDLCGFPKAAAFWYRTQWLLSIPDGPDKTFPTNGAHEVHLVESWESPDSFPSTRGNKTRAIHAYSSAPSVELLVNGKSQGKRAVGKMVQGPGSYAEWTEVPWEAGTLTAVAQDARGQPVANVSRQTNGKPAAIALSIDAPSQATGTGTALLLDGQDAALLRASVVDNAGQVVHLASNNISFRVVSGPGIVQGSHNGDPHCHDPNNAPWHTAYHGLVRAVIRVTSTAARPIHERKLLQQIDVHGPMAADNQLTEGDGPIVVEASSPGFKPVTISIPVSTDPLAAGVMAVAEAGAGKPVDFFGSASTADLKAEVAVVI